MGYGRRIPVLGSNERVSMGFKHGSDSTVFTSKGVLDVHIEGSNGKKFLFRCIPYSSIRRFATESNGSNQMVDQDCELKLVFSTPWLPKVNLDFGDGKISITTVQNLIASKLLGNPEEPSDLENEKAVIQSIPGSTDKLIAYIDDDNLDITPTAIEENLRKEISVLYPNEGVELVFKHGRDMFLITTKRVINIDVQGLTGKKVEIASFPFNYINAFSVESAGALGRTSKVALFISKLEEGAETEFGKDNADIFELSNAIAKKIMAHTVHEQ